MVGFPTLQYQNLSDQFQIYPFKHCLNIINMILNEPIQSQDHLCGICSELIVHARILNPCGHIFCNMCVFRVLEHSRADLRCPMCRHPITRDSLASAPDVDKAIKQSHPEKYAAKIEQYRDWVERRKVVFEVGNTAVHDPRTTHGYVWHRWTFFVRELELLGDTEKYIRRIEVNLYPFYPGDPIILRNQPFEFWRVGCGTFNIKFTIHWTEIFDNVVENFEYPLNFRAPEENRKYLTKFFKVDLPEFEEAPK